MKSLLSALLLGLLIVVSTTAATAAPSTATTTANDPALLKRVQTLLDTDNVVRGDFTQTRQLAGIKKPLIANGSFTVDKKLGVLWRTTKPFNQITRITQNEILQKDGAQVLMKLSADKEPAVQTISRVLFSVFSGDLAVLSQYFDHSGRIEGNNWHLNFKPREAGLAAVIGELSLDGDRVARHVVLTSAAGDITKIDFANTTTAASLTADEAAQFK